MKENLRNSHFPSVSVVILNFNGLSYLGTGLSDCVESVLKSEYPSVEVIFVDNGSVDGSLKFVEEHYGRFLKIIANKKNLGFSEGFNSGIKASKGKYIALLSNDMNVAETWLNPIVELMQADPKVGLAGFKRFVRGSNRLLDGIGGDLYLCGRVKPIGTGEIDNGQYEKDIDNLDFIGGAMVLRRKTLQEVGLIDRSFAVFSEDIDLCFRIRKAGYRVMYVHDAVIWHKGQSTLTGMDPKGLFLEYASNQNRIRCGLIHFSIRRILAACLIDIAWFMMARSASKKIILQAYSWNLKNIAVTLRKRIAYGPSPPSHCKYPVLPFNFVELRRRINAIFS